mmetsp:Transcript_13758/g.33317  ORF Transcript_13758/g.33317 Transcript_13758/m.33317 type:complete len:1098 (+) Transcript_13758:142-3435(+)
MNGIKPSYANAVANVVSTTSSWGMGKPPTLASQVKELSHPTPTSMTLTAALYLLAPLKESSDVYLMTRSYMQNWLIWAYNQNVPKMENQRVQTALRLAATRLGLHPPEVGFKYNDPGPVDNSSLSLEGSPLLLNPCVIVQDLISDNAISGPKSPNNNLGPRARSLPVSPGSVNGSDEVETQPTDEDLDRDGDQILCCAVPAKFYELLRSTIGITCVNGRDITFQPYVQEAGPYQGALIHHHPLASNDEKEAPTPMSRNDPSCQMNGIAKTPCRPLEFRRKIIMKRKLKRFTSGEIDESSPMTRLLKEEEQRAAPELVPTVEVRPVKLQYSVIDGNNIRRREGIVLVSQTSRVYDALFWLMKVAAPNTSSSCKRIWSKRDTTGTASGDGYELVDLNFLDGKMEKDSEKEKEFQPPRKLVGEWLRAHYYENTKRDCDIIIEVRKSNDKWLRASLELENRILVGDYVDAQDAAGNWYESIVTHVNDDTVTVHYFGWASRWNGRLRRRQDSPVPASIAKLHCAAPLWSHSSRWRERIAEGNTVEVRSASSKVDRPKWYKGIVKRIGQKRVVMKRVTGGAPLEMIVGKDEKKRPLLLLNRVQQIMVEVPQENDKMEDEEEDLARKLRDDVSIDTLTTMDTFKPQPPFLRWVNLYGEEICEFGTHMKSNGGLNVATLQYEVESHRKPVEIMKSFNNMYGQGFMKESLRGIPPAPGSVGMHNLGNSCFINSIVQCLNHMEPLTQYFLNGDYAKELNRRNPLGSGGRVATAYAAMLKEIWSNKYSALAPRMLKQTVASFAPQFNNSYQHDSQEFCQFLMDGLHEDCNRVKEKPYVEELEGIGLEDAKAAIEAWRKHLLRHDSIIVDRCQGMHRSHLTCPKCGKESVKFDAFSTISLPLTADKTNINGMTLQDCVDKFLEGEQLDELNAWYCPSCKKHVCALKMIALWSVPDILILHLKRFQFDHCTVRNDVIRSKINDTVRFPIERLDLRNHVLGPIYDDAPPIYRLCGVSEHMGPTANSGHYTATVRNCKDSRWYRYNDAHVGETTADAAVTGGAYLLFYERLKGSARWGGMEKLMKERNAEPYGGPNTDQDGFTTVKSKKKRH